MSLQKGGCPELRCNFLGNNNLTGTEAYAHEHKVVCDRWQGRGIVLVHWNGASVFIPLENTAIINLCGSRMWSSRRTCRNLTMKYLNIAKVTCNTEFQWWCAMTYCACTCFFTGVHGWGILWDTSSVIMCSMCVAMSVVVLCNGWPWGLCFLIGF